MDQSSEGPARDGLHRLRGRGGRERDRRHFGERPAGGHGERPPKARRSCWRETPFYAEMGGQKGDQGVIGSETGRIPGGGHAAPRARPHRPLRRDDGGHLRVGSPIRAQVNADRRRAIMRNHSATHLLHRALKDIFGEQVNQRGSLVGRRPAPVRFQSEPSDHDRGAARGGPPRERMGARRPARDDAGRCRTKRRWRPARWPCSARSTAIRSAS